LRDRGIEDFGRRIQERFIIAGDGACVPGGMLKIGPLPMAITVVEHQVSNRLDPVVQQFDQHGALLIQAAVAVREGKVLLRIVAGTVCPGITRRWEPDQVKMAVSDGAGVLPHNAIPRPLTKRCELGVFGMSMPVRFPVEALEHDAVVIEPCLRQDSDTTEDDDGDGDQQSSSRT
jgi:hypothetical protein